jgi:hypothetical protein
LRAVAVRIDCTQAAEQCKIGKVFVYGLHFVEYRRSGPEHVALPAAGINHCGLRDALELILFKRNQYLVMPALVAGIHDLKILNEERRGWPGQARP